MKIVYIKHKLIKLLPYFQLFQLLTCDWLLETRTALWEYEQSQNVSDIYIPVSGSVMSKFQKDLNSLRSVTEEIPVSKSKQKKIKRKLKEQ